MGLMRISNELKVIECKTNENGELECIFQHKDNSRFVARVGKTRNGEVYPTGISKLEGDAPTPEAVDKALQWMQERVKVIV